MRLKFNPEIMGLLEIVRGEMDAACETYLVGGAVRDAIIGREINDLDFAMEGDPTQLAKRVAKRLQVPFFLLDDERHTARVLYRNQAGQFSPLDFVQFTGNGLDDDLYNRDFTINAIALSVRNLSQVIDPLNGQSDLEAGLLRPCTAHALLDDPVRVLRGIRVALQFNLAYSSDLPSLMRAASRNLPETSNERQRDEFFKILEGPEPGEGVSRCREFAVFETLIPPLADQASIPASPPHTLPLLDHTIAAVAHLAVLVDLIISGESDDGSAWWVTHAVEQLSQFSNEIKAYISEEVTPGRSKRGLVLLGTLLHDIGKPRTMKSGKDERLHYYGHAREGAEMAWVTARHLRLSNAEASWVQTMVRRHMDLLPMINQKEPLSRQAIYRYFQKTGDVGIAIALLSLADTLATYGEDISREQWMAAVHVTRGLLLAWWDLQKAVVSPELFLNGDDLQSEFGLDPGKQIGRLLEALREAQAVGQVTNRLEARAFILARIKSNQGG